MTSGVQKRVLYFAPRRGLAAEFFRALAGAAGCQARRQAEGAAFRCDDAQFSFVVRRDVEAALEALHQGFFNLVLLDLREPVHGSARRGDSFAQGLALLEAMDHEVDLERRYGFHRVVALVSGHDSPEVDGRIATLGSRGVRHVMRDQAACPYNRKCDLLPDASQFARRVLEEIEQLVLHRKVGQKALCASGGGITGLYFELGALKCLEDCCSPGALNEFDQYYGISAGGVVTGIIANGYTVTEFMASIAGVETGRLPALDLNLLDLSHLDFRGLTMPLRQLLTLTAAAARQLAHLRSPFSLESLVFEYGDLIHAPFQTDGFEALLADSFSRNGCSNDFRTLRRRLFIGATDQDRKEHVLFGAPPFDDVPISRAIQASMSLNPVFSPTAIHGRYYEDGAVTRTSNFVEAIAKGADLVFALDPLVPYVSKEAGFARARGVFYNADQDIRTVSFTRYETTRNFVMRQHPEVSLYTFLPANNLRRLMSVNPMDHRPFLEIWRGAYLGTLRRIHALGYRMRGDLGAHGIAFDAARADAVADRLESARRLAFSDFFADGRVEVLPPPQAAAS
jgi:predicted acylesterase/phospholipase RssA/CheY-like chemotaxis protein